MIWPLLAEATTYIYTITTIQLVYRHTHTHRRLFGALSLLLCCCGTATTILHGCCCSTPSFFLELTRVVPPPCAVWLPFRRPPSHRRRATHTFWCCSRSTRRRHLNPNWNQWYEDQSYPPSRAVDTSNRQHGLATPFGVIHCILYPWLLCMASALRPSHVPVYYPAINIIIYPVTNYLFYPASRCPIVLWPLQWPQTKWTRPPQPAPLMPLVHQPRLDRPQPLREVLGVVVGVSKQSLRRKTVSPCLICTKVYFLLDNDSLQMGHILLTCNKQQLIWFLSCEYTLY